MKTIKLTKNLSLIEIADNLWKNDKLLTVVCYFSFFGETGEAFIRTERARMDNPSFACTEISSELSDSFNELLEENWDKISKAVLNYEKQWNKQFA